MTLNKVLATVGFLWSLIEVAAGHPTDGVLTAMLSIAMLTNE